MKLAIILNDKKLSGLLTRIMTGCYAYHVAWVSDDTKTMYDMHFQRRRRHWPYYSKGQIMTFEFPQVTQDFQEHKLTTDEAVYGVIDYCLFLLRPVYHLFGKSTRNVGGVICSEMTNSDLIECGVETPWPADAPPPSPCDILRWLTTTSK